MKEKVLTYLINQEGGKTPTEIGIALGKDYNQASSSVSKALKQLIEENWVERYKINGKVLYKYTIL